MNIARFAASLTLVATIFMAASEEAAGEISAERGLRVSIVGGCHDCHTEGYRQSEGKLDPEKSLKGSQIGWRGPWGTTYASNLRLTARALTEDGFVLYTSTLKTSPPMPWYRVRAMQENELRSLYRYIKSLGDAGEQAPTALGPEVEPTTTFVVLEPPQSPAGCKRDLDCGVGQICGSSSQCVSR
jgi:mono/diheme cytochrome c family protein